MPATSGVPDHNGSGPPLAPDPPRWRRVFPGDQPQLAVLRRWLYALLPDCPARSDIICVATELGTNAVLHTATGRGGWFAVEITWYGTVVRVAVADCGGPGEPRMIEHSDDEHGRGLAVVRGLAVRAGYQGDHHGRMVWADLPWDETGSQADALADPCAAHQGGDASAYWAGEASLSA